MMLQIQWSRYLPNTLLALALVAILMGCGRSEESVNASENAGNVTSTEAVVVDSNAQPTTASVPTPVESSNDVAPTDMITPSDSLSPGGMGGSPTMPDMANMPGMPENFDSVVADQNTLLAEALGISVDELEAARQRMMESAMPSVPAAGQGTPPAGNNMPPRGDAPNRQNMPPGGGSPGGNGNPAMQSALAAELGISVEELQSANAAAWSAALAQAVADGRLTQEEADVIATRMTQPE